MQTIYFHENRKDIFLTFLGVLFEKQSDLYIRKFSRLHVCDSLAWHKYFKIELNYPAERRQIFYTIIINSLTSLNLIQYLID